MKAVSERIGEKRKYDILHLILPVDMDSLIRVMRLEGDEPLPVPSVLSELLLCPSPLPAGFEHLLSPPALC